MCVHARAHARVCVCVRVSESVCLCLCRYVRACVLARGHVIVVRVFPSRAIFTGKQNLNAV